MLNAINGSMECWLEVSRFSSDDFVSHREIFRFFQSHLTQYGSLPSATQISTRFNWQPPIGDFRYWLAEMKRYSMARKVMDVMVEAHNRIQNTTEAIDILLDRVSNIRAAENHHIGATDAAAAERLDKFNIRTQYIYQSNSMVGLPTGLKIIDNTHIGHLPGSMMGIYARPGVGKTWFLLEQGAQSWMTGHRVLAITPEMPKPLLDLRIDTVIGAHLGLHIDYGKLIVGDPSILPNYQRIIEIMAQSNRWWTYDSIDEHPIGIGDLAALIRQHEPSILLIDGISLLRSESRGQVWEQMKELCYGLKNLGTIYDMPIVVTHQAVNSARGRRTEITAVGRGDDFVMPSLNDAAYGDSFVGACTDVITMCGDPTVSYIRWYSIRKHRERGMDPPARLAIAVDYAHGIMHDLSDLGYNEERVGAEARRILGVR